MTDEKKIILYELSLFENRLCKYFSEEEGMKTYIISEFQRIRHIIHEQIKVKECKCHSPMK